MKTGEYEFAGILQKRGRWNPQWKSRAFAIRKSAIDYFRCDNNKTQQIGSIPFDSLMVFEKNQVATAVPKKIDCLSYVLNEGHIIYKQKMKKNVINGYKK